MIAASKKVMVPSAPHDQWFSPKFKRMYVTRDSLTSALDLDLAPRMQDRMLPCHLQIPHARTPIKKEESEKMSERERKDGVKS